MAIEFRCTQCNRLLRTSDDAAGKQAKCPGCGLVLTVPAAAGGGMAGSIFAAPPGTGGVPAAPAGAGSIPAAPTGAGNAPPAAGKAPTPAGATPFGTSWAGAAPGGPQGPSGPVNPYQSPSNFPASPSWLPVAAGTIVPTTVDLGDVFSRTWTVFKDQYGMCLGLYLAAFGLSFVANMVIQGIQIGVAAALQDPVVNIGVTIVATLAAYIFGFWLTLGQVRGMIGIARGQPTSIAVLFSGGPYLLPFFLAAILLGLIFLGILLAAGAVAGPVAYLGWQGGGGGRLIAAAVGGAVLAVIPLMVVWLMFSQFHRLIVDRNADAVQSLDLSRQITRGNKLILFVSQLLIGLVGGVIAVFTCGLGFLLGVGPFDALLGAMFYLAMSGQTTADQLRYETWQNPPPMPPPLSPGR